MVKCDECMMYEPDDNYCRWFQQCIPDITYECTVEYDERLHTLCKYNTSVNEHFVGYCKHPRNYFEEGKRKGWKLVECKKCPCDDFTVEDVEE
jgi:hypothetical protein